MKVHRSFVIAITTSAALMMFAGPRANAADKLSKSDMAFVMKANEGGDAEVALGKLAETNGYSTEVKAFGKQMVEDHTKANNELISIAKDNDVRMSHELKGEQKEAYEKLAKLNGQEFDKEYIRAMLKDHKEDVQLFSDEASSGNDGRLKEFASKTLKVIEHHLAMAKDIAPKVGEKE